ncbi:MAG TPA: hypothetical protein VMM56_06950, partial [Planctomycetaceae bacterium]|nr:hypothetical protein [Planctomycetaceae bacterium]
PAGPLIVSTIEAQSETGDIDAGASGGGAIDLSVPQNAIEAKLSQPFPDQINYIDISLSDALNLISQVIEVDILIDGNVSEQLDQGQTVNLVLQYGNVTTKTLIALLFEQAGLDDDFSYIVRDEILYITEKQRTMTVRVYNCRDLVGEGSDPAMGIGFPGFGGGVGFDMGESGATGVSPFGGESGGGYSPGALGGDPGMGMSGDMMGEMGSGNYPREKDPLVSVVTQTVAPHSWNEVGGDGSARLFNGLLVVKNTAEVHQQVEELLKMIREAQKVDPGNWKSISQ